SRTLSNFSSGVYLVWNVSGHVTLRVTKTGGINAVASGLFLGAGPGASVSFVKQDTSTQGNWRAAYGSDGYNLARDLASPAARGAPVRGGQSMAEWATSPPDTRGLLGPGTPATRLAATWYTYSSSSFTIDLNFNDAAQHQVALYCVDWDYQGRSQTIDVLGS